MYRFEKSNQGVMKRVYKSVPVTPANPVPEDQPPTRSDGNFFK